MAMHISVDMEWPDNDRRVSTGTLMGTNQGHHHLSAKSERGIAPLSL